jgi:hypothetical protein
LHCAWYVCAIDVNAIYRRPYIAGIFRQRRFIAVTSPINDIWFIVAANQIPLTYHSKSTTLLFLAGSPSHTKLIHHAIQRLFAVQVACFRVLFAWASICLENSYISGYFLEQW